MMYVRVVRIKKGWLWGTQKKDGWNKDSRWGRSIYKLEVDTEERELVFVSTGILSFIFFFPLFFSSFWESL